MKKVSSAFYMLEPKFFDEFGLLGNFGGKNKIKKIINTPHYIFFVEQKYWAVPVKKLDAKYYGARRTRSRIGRLYIDVFFLGSKAYLQMDEMFPIHPIFIKAPFYENKETQSGIIRLDIETEDQILKAYKDQRILDIQNIIPAAYDLTYLLKAYDETNTNQKLLLEMIHQNASKIGYISKSLRGDWDFVKKTVQGENYRDFVYFIPASVWSDKKKLLRWISANGLLIEFAAKELQRDPEVIKAAVAQNPDAMLLLAKR